MLWTSKQTSLKTIPKLPLSKENKEENPGGAKIDSKIVIIEAESDKEDNLTVNMAKTIFSSIFRILPFFIWYVSFPTGHFIKHKIEILISFFRLFKLSILHYFLVYTVTDMQRGYFSEIFYVSFHNAQVISSSINSYFFFQIFQVINTMYNV